MDRRNGERRLCPRVEYGRSEKPCILKNRYTKYTGFVIDMSCSGLKISKLSKDPLLEDIIYVLIISYANMRHYLKVKVVWKKEIGAVSVYGLKLANFSSSWVTALVNKKYVF